jgi:hypothetical protein
VGKRQFACPKPACQKKREAVQQAAWRRRNPDYFTARRIAEKASAERPETPVLRSPLDRLPWDVAQMQFKAEGAEFLAEFGRVLAKHAQVQMRPEAVDTS